MQATADFISAVIELTTHTQLGHHAFERRTTCFSLNINRDTRPIIGNRHRIVGMQRHHNAVTPSRQRFVNRVIDNFIHHVMQRFNIFTAYIHTRAGTNMRHLVEQFNIFRSVSLIIGRGHDLFCHRVSSWKYLC